MEDHRYSTLIGSTAWMQLDRLTEIVVEQSPALVKFFSNPTCRGKTKALAPSGGRLVLTVKQAFNQEEAGGWSTEATG